MLLTKAIRFRSLTEDLTPKERTEFINNVSSSNEPLIIKALFHHFIQESPGIQKEVDSMNAQLSGIIETRERTSSQKTAFLFTLADVSNAIIGNIASYLTQNDYFRFSRTSRPLYLACNTPNMLREIRVRNVHACTDLSLFLGAKKIILSVDQSWGSNVFEKVMESIKDISELNTLTLLKSDPIDQIAINTLELYSSNNILVNKIEVLTMSGYSQYQWDSTTFPKRLMKSLMKFKNVRFLDFSFPHEHQYGDAQLKAMAKAFSNLKGLRMNMDFSGITKYLLRTTGEYLEFLSIIEPNCEEWEDNDEMKDVLKVVDFGNLKEFEWVSAITDAPLGAILKTAKNLRKFRFATEMDEVNAQVKAQDIRNLLTKCPSLQYLGLDLIASTPDDENEDYKVCDILDAIDGGLFDTRNRKRDSLKIQIKGWVMGSEADECIRRLDQIISSLALSDVQDFMIMIDFEEGVFTEEGRWEHSRFVDPEMFRRRIAGVRVFKRKNMMMITNDDCRICGYSESWIM